MKSGRTFIPAEELLEPVQLAQLTKPARTFYAAVRNHMNWSGESTFFWSDTEASRFARLGLPLVPAARHELEYAGLLAVSLDEASDGRLRWYYNLPN
jgi:hypothetical protein